MKEENKKELTPSQYFDYLKEAKKTITTEALKESYEVFLTLAEKYNKLGQVESMKKLCFLADTLIKEEELIEAGITTYVYKDTIEDYIENVAGKAVKIIELSRYMREIPDELVETVEKARGIFDELYVVFTDYTGKEERKVERERRDKDPILFGAFKDRHEHVADRFYFLGDWVDEYCDLTLDKMVEQYKEKKGYSPAINNEIPKNAEELKELLQKYEITGTKNVPMTNEGVAYSIDTPIYRVDNNKKVKKGFFDKVMSVFKKKKE